MVLLTSGKCFRFLAPTRNRRKPMKALYIVVMVAMITACAEAGTAPSRERLIKALIAVESNGNDRAIGDRHMKDKAYGALQVRKPCVDDVNRRFGTQYKAQDCLGNRELSVSVCQKYLEMYATRTRLGREPTFEDMARIWNGGPNGHKKESTNGYWSKVKKVLART